MQIIKKTTLKKIISFAIVVLVSVLCCACSAGQQSTTSAVQQSDQSDEKVTVSQSSDVTSESDSEVYKLPLKITNEDGTEYEHNSEINFDYRFVDTEPTEYEDDVIYLLTDDRGLVIKAIDCDIYDETFEFEYNDGLLVSKISGYKDNKIVATADFAYSDDNKTITAEAYSYVEDVSVYNYDQYVKYTYHVNENGNLLSREANLSGNLGTSIINSHGYYKEYDEYGNVIIDRNSESQKSNDLQNIQYDADNNITKATIHYLYQDDESTDAPTESYKELNMTYDSDGYITHLETESIYYDFTYTEYSKEEYEALKKLSVVWGLASFEDYYMTPRPDFVNFYKK